MVLEWIKTYKYSFIACFILLVYLYLFFNGYFESIDIIVYKWIHSYMSSSLTSFMISFTFLGSVIGSIIICIICIVIHIKKGLWISLHVFIVALINVFIKNIVQRERPSFIRLVIEKGYSFPSAHAMASFTLFGFISYFLWKKYKYLSCLMMCFPFLIGITRIYLGVHYFSDVIAGFLFAFAYLSILIPMCQKHGFTFD